MLDLAGSAPSHQVKALVNGSIEMLMYSDHGRRYGAPSVTQQDNVLPMQIIFQYRDWHSIFGQSNQPCLRPTLKFFWLSD